MQTRKRISKPGTHGSAEGHSTIVGEASTAQDASLEANLTPIEYPDWLQQMYDAEPMQWTGGEHHYDGPIPYLCF